MEDSTATELRRVNAAAATTGAWLEQTGRGRSSDWPQQSSNSNGGEAGQRTRKDGEGPN